MAFVQPTSHHPLNATFNLHFLEQLFHSSHLWVCLFHVLVSQFLLENDRSVLSHLESLGVHHLFLFSHFQSGHCFQRIHSCQETYYFLGEFQGLALVAAVAHLVRVPFDV